MMFPMPLKLLSSHSKDDLKDRFIWLNDYK